MIKSIAFSTALAFATALAGAAAAQPAPDARGASCPPGSWFCADAAQQKPEPAGEPVQPMQPLPDPDEQSAPPPPPNEEVRRPRPARPLPRRPPPYEYPPAPSPVPRPPPPYEYPPAASPLPMSEPPPPPYEYPRLRHLPISPRHEWGLNLHAEGAMVGKGTQGNAGMGGLGVGLRFKPVRSFGIEADLDFAGGDHDYSGNQRSETALMFNGLWFLNPRSHAQIYVLAGLGISGAHVTCDSCTTPVDVHYNYFGGQIGGGLELRLARALAFNLDIRGFVRGRTDTLAQTQPEFEQPAGCSTNGSASGTCRTTNSSGGGLLTGGMTLYF